MRRLPRAFLSIGAALLFAPRPTPAQRTTVDLVVAATTDVHGHLRGWDYYANAPDPARGLTRAATIVDSLRAADPGRVLLVDAGDLLQGTPLTYLAGRSDARGTHPVVAAMNAMRYDAAAIGNHEFNYGLPVLRRAIGQASFPFLAANAYTPAGRRAFPAWRTLERAGARIAIIGGTTPGANIWDRENLRGQVEIRDIVPSVRAATDSVRRAGADVVIVVLHSGLGETASYDTATTGLPSENVAARVAHEVPGIDLIVYGHSHQQMADTTIGTTLLMQPKNWATNVAVARLKLERDGARWRVVSRASRLVPARGRAESPAVLAATKQAHEATVAYVTRTIGSTPVTWRADSARVTDTPLIDLILDVERRVSGAELASTAAFSLDATLDSGKITIAQVARLYPYENTLKAVRISGRQLREYLEYSARYFGTYGTNEPAVDPNIPGYNFDIISGADYTIDLSRPVGSRITRLEVKGRPVADADSFTMALNNYRQSGGGGYAMLQGAPVVYDGQKEIRELLIEEVIRRGRLQPSDVFQRNWSIVPAAAAARAYAAMHRVSWEHERAAATTLPRLRIIATNDFHGALDPVADSGGPRRGGATAIAATIGRAAKSCPGPCETLLVDGGDLFQGSAASNLAYGTPVVELYNALGYTAAALGNHEFDWGVDTLRARMREARFAFLAANVRYRNGRPVEWIRGDTLVERGPLKVGIIGVIGAETYGSTMASNVRPFRFTDPVPVVDSLARSLRARGANAVIVLAHSGAFCNRAGTAACNGEIIKLAQQITEPVDAIVSGHTHSLVDFTVKGIPIVQARSNGRAVAVVDLQIGSGRSEVLDARVHDVLADSLPPVPAVDSLVRRSTSRVAALVSRPVARLAAPMPRQGTEYALGNLVADAERWAGKADIAVINNGGIRTGLPAGEVTYGALFEVQPFANSLHRLTVTGVALRRYFERLVARGAPRVHVSGATITYDSSRRAGSRIRQVQLDGGRPLRDDAKYTIVLNEYMATGSDGATLARGALAREVITPTDLDALVTYLESRPQPVAPPQGFRFIKQTTP
jgi:2',3'-cyclic-nucleotide 2'-phosphodiesterase (5'-nucleotidase family)